MSLLLPLLHQLPPETAHRLALHGLQLGLLPRLDRARWPRLRTRLAGLDLPNPLGLAAGFDKDAAAFAGLAKLGFGFVEVGTITPRPQLGNPRPRLFRLPAQQALINRMGFNNQGLAAAQRRLAKRRPDDGVLGANIGANKDSADPIADYVAGLRGLYGLVDYLTINVSSPNTPGLRDLQATARLRPLLDALLDCRAALAAGAAAKPLFLKLAPDLDQAAEAEIAALAVELGLDGLIICNTTLARPPELSGPHRDEAGGLSGRPLRAPATAQLARFHRLTAGRLPLIGVGGIANAADAWARLQAGASALQLYTALIYQGPAMIGRLLGELDQLLAAAAAPLKPAAAPAGSSVRQAG